MASSTSAAPAISLSRRVESVAPSITLAMTARAKALAAEGKDIVGFGAGEPDFDTPDFIKQAAVEALAAGQTKYTPTPCLPQLRQAIARKFREENGLDYTPEQICVGPGGKGALYFAFLALLNDGDEVLIPAPYWVSYPEQAKLCGGVLKFVFAEESADFKLTPEQLEAAITPRTRIFILNSPNNPAGNCYSPDELQALADVLARHEQVIVFSDEIYEKLLYNGQETASIAALHPALFDRTITFNCHSKTFAMTGWRVGYAGGPANVIAAMNKAQGQINSHITSFCQLPAALALTDQRSGDAVEKMRREFEKRGDHMHRRLSRIPGITCIKPRGAFYCFPNISACFGKSAGGRRGTTVRECDGRSPCPTDAGPDIAFGDPAPSRSRLVAITDAMSFAEALLEQQGVAVIPGNDSGFPTHVRLSFATSMEQIDKGLERVETFVRELR